MKRLLQVLLVLFVLLLLAVGGALYGVHWYVQSPKGIARIQSELGHALGMPLEIQGASLGWGGVRLEKVRIVSEEKTFLEAPAFTTEYQFLPLLHRQVVLRKMVLESPNVTWPQNAEGKWVLPTRARGPKSDVPSAPKVAAPVEKDFQLALDSLEIKNGTIEMLDNKGVRFAHMEGVQIKASLANTAAISATVTANSLALLQGGPVFEKVLLPFQYAGTKLDFPQCEGSLGGGTVKGSFSLEPKAADVPYDIQLTLEKVNLARAIADPDWQIRSGELGASLTLQGSSKAHERVTGRGEIHLTQAGVDTLEPLLRLIGETCKVPELANLKLSLEKNLGSFAQTLGLPETASLREASTVFELSNKETVIDSLMVDAGDLAVRLKGTISQEGKLNLPANLSVSPKLAKELPTFVAKSLETNEPNGRRGVDFKVSGTNDHPKTDLVDKILGKQIPTQFSEIVTSIFKKKGGDSDMSDDEKKEKKKKDKENMTDAEKQEKKERKAKEAKAKEDELAKGASPDANAIPAPATPATPPAPAPAPTSPAGPAN